MAFVSVLGNRESAITDEAKNHLSSAAQAMARDYAREDFRAQSQSPLELAGVQASDDALFAVTAADLQNERGSEGGFYSLRADRLLAMLFRLTKVRA